jgi:hypothetical protein
VSASCSFPNKSNKQNLDFSHQFIEFDIDDGRSSKLCQNEEDESYFGELEVEFNSSGKIIYFKKDLTKTIIIFKQNMLIVKFIGYQTTIKKMAKKRRNLLIPI